VDSQRNIAVVLDTEDLNKSIKSNAALDVCTESKFRNLVVVMLSEREIIVDSGMTGFF
jgi:hypothetical protein